jgi:hypothetical protein
MKCKSRYLLWESSKQYKELFVFLPKITQTEFPFPFCIQPISNGSPTSDSVFSCPANFSFVSENQLHTLHLENMTAEETLTYRFDIGLETTHPCPPQGRPCWPNSSDGHIWSNPSTLGRGLLVPLSQEQPQVEKRITGPAFYYHDLNGVPSLAQRVNTADYYIWAISIC